ncbi:helix-turn-helix domain-containing protein [Anaerotignum sp. MB30-C6]|uniref:helix-turn-helix domain-containing protein n=1 Tax=Anaerotignum sp. MB30-C6 TaxID=3070814 RepID=UPI0027DAB837|nr:helix-turn-helix transcriptional regulator [Anaerotignum sp. MB30-C6]WMI81275.1 helix-turn-helix transcriptional regulator [Anaerotignum sp. MB30-C6]
MKEVSIHVGKRIRLYRKMKNLTIETFAGMINKSKATVSKYENGDISIDIETLFSIADALDISVNQLVDYENPASLSETEGEALTKRKAGKTRYYLYFYDGRRGRIVKNIIEVQGVGENGIYNANFYADLEDYTNCYKCKFLYHGTMRKFDAFTNFNFENQNNKVEQVFMYAINSFTHNSRMVGMLSGLSTHPILPASFKFLLSPDIMEENEEMKEQLVFTKEDIKYIKKMNMFVINQHP